MRALITASFDPGALARLERHMSVVHEDWKTRHHIWFDGAEFAKHIAALGADVLVVEADLVQAEVFDAVSLRLVGVCRAEPVNIDLEAATRHGVPVFHTPGRNADAVADLTLCFLLMLARRLPAIDAAYRGGVGRIDPTTDYLEVFNRFAGLELGGRTVGIVGYGAVGREVVARLRPFKARILVCDPYVDSVPADVARSDFESLLRESDFVSLHAAVTPETQGMLDADKLALMKPTAYLVNTARAALTDEDAVYDALRAGRLAGAALDVLCDEPLQPGHRFLALPNVICTPHIAGATLDVVRHQSEIIVEAIERHLRGERPRWVANPAVYEARS